MLYSLLADATVLVHALFVLFVVCGGLAVLRWPRLAWLHLPAVVWGVAIEWTGGICPLTYLENHWRRMGGAAGYGGTFVQRYLEPLLYPLGLTLRSQVVLGFAALLVNLVVYGYLGKRRRSGNVRRG
ncbi:MAG TPA: DUF2784 domain-containing protein [Desulfuromonadaceae bacterium]